MRSRNGPFYELEKTRATPESDDLLVVHGTFTAPKRDDDGVPGP